MTRYLRFPTAALLGLVLACSPEVTSPAPGGLRPTLALADLIPLANLIVDNSSNVECLTATHTTIQAAINAANAGDFILVCPGTYAEILTVNVANLTLAGPNAGTPATAVRAAEAIIQGTFAVGAQQDGITMDGFRIEGTGTLRGLGVTVKNNVFVGSGQTGPTTSSSAPVRANSFAILNNSFTGYGLAVRLDGNSLTESVLISGNHISGNTRAINTNLSMHSGPVGNAAVVAAQIIDNVITSNTDGGIRLAAGGFDVHRNVISGNVPYGMRVGLTGGVATSATNATCNWWGHASGPSGVGLGSGNALVDESVPQSVVFLPWSVTAAAEQPCSGGQATPDTEAPVVTNVTVTPNPAPYTTTSYTLTADATDNVAVTSAWYTVNGVGLTAFSFTSDPDVDLSDNLLALDAGVYDICVTAEDAAGNESNTECTMLAVYDPTAGFVTGGGWFNSPAGAYILDPLLTGKATFGFVSKYVKGKMLPTGNTEFQFKAGNLSFSSSAYEWLVVNQGGTNAQFKGTGALNGVAGYKFMVWAKDGTPDTFRIQIEDGAGTVVYDNNQDDSFGTELGGGSIVIHVPKK